MIMTIKQTDLWQKLLTIVITLMVIVTGYMGTAVNSLSETQTDLSKVVAVMGNDILNHNINAIQYIEQIQKNTERIIDLEKGNAVATADRITKEEALSSIQRNTAELKIWIEKNYLKR